MIGDGVLACELCVDTPATRSHARSHAHAVARHPARRHARMAVAWHHTSVSSVLRVSRSLLLSRSMSRVLRVRLVLLLRVGLVLLRVRRDAAVDVAARLVIHDMVVY